MGDEWSAWQVPVGGWRTGRRGRRSDLIAGKFRLIRRIGGGGSCEVWEAATPPLRRGGSRRVALKVLSSLDLDPDLLFRQARDEAARCRAARHPNVVEVYGLGLERPFLVLELVPGGRTLVDALAERWLDVGPDRAPIDRWAASVTHRISDAIECAHENGVVHRDVKLSNVLVRPDGDPVLADFGLAGSLGGADGLVTVHLLGTPRCRAPEQVRRARLGKDRSTDVYQLGLLLHDLLTNQALFGGDVSTIDARVARGAAPSPREIDPRVPRRLDEICRRAMAPPRARFRSAAELRDALARFLSGGTGEPLHRRAARGGARVSLRRSGT